MSQAPDFSPSPQPFMRAPAKQAMEEKEQVVEPRPYLDLISHLSRIVAHTPDLKGLLKSSVQVIQSALEAESCSIMLMNEAKTELTMEASSSIPEDLWKLIRVKVGEEVAGKVVQTGQPLLVSEKTDTQPAKRSKKPVREYHTKSYLCVPLRTTQEIIGVVNVTDHVQRREMTIFDLEMLEATAQVIACAIDNHRIFVRTQESRMHLAMVLEGLPVGMLTINGNGLLTLCNRSARRYLNLSPGIQLNMPWEHYFPEPLRTHFETALKHLAAHRSSHTDEFEVPSGNADSRRSVRISAFEAEDIASLESHDILFIVEDLQQMQELVELRRSDQMKSNFLSLISHELRTPLASIKGAIHLLNQMAPPEMQQSAERIFTLLHRNSDRLTRLVNNILDAMDLEARTLRLYRKRTDLHGMINRVIGKYSSVGQEKGIQWSMNLAAVNPDLYVDESRLAQVVDHLVENAVKFAQKNGTIDISTSSNDSQWILRVYNTGRAIEPVQHEKIFAKFYQVDGSLTRDSGGSGLGLYLCREIVRKHDGNIRVDPTCLSGACFEVSLPIITELA